MNHLCGLPNLHDECDNALHSNLTDGERGVLTAFRQRYESALCHECNNNNNNNSNVDADEEKKDSSSQLPLVPFTTPTYEISDDQLSPSGLRLLDDITLYRYLLADRLGDGTFDANASYQRLLAALQFRKQHTCHVIVQHLTSCNIPPNIQKCQRLRVGIWAGVDRQSRPVVFERLGQFFGSGNVRQVSQEDWMTSYLYFLEMHFFKMRESAKQSGRAVNRIVYFADFQGVISSILNRKIWKVIPLLKSLVNTVECHYPEIVDHITLFNVPRVASAVYNVIKGFLDPVTAKKIELFPGVPYDRFKELMSEDVIPVEYGGKNRVDYPPTASK
mmetsp:Transcript_23028/g.42266  ORF Transcript_23028/g.42266 Transcript_23028/m.42266 type:complete len:331 (-) Transcript_23028:312-1304(-)